MVFIRGSANRASQSGEYSVSTPGMVGRLTKEEEGLFNVAKEGGSREKVVEYYTRGVNFAAQDEIFGNTPLLWALANGCQETADAIIDCSVEATLRKQDVCFKNTALHLVVGKGYETVTSSGDPVTVSCYFLAGKLIGRGASINAQNAKGNTPLHLACLRRDREMIQFLLEQPGSSLDVPFNAVGETPRDLLQKDYDTACSMLQDNVTYFVLSPDRFDAHSQSATGDA